MSADRNLLFGILALQMDFLSRDALVEAMHAWVLDKKKSLGQILVKQGALREEERLLLEPVVQKHVERHEGDPQKSLAAVSSLGPVRQDLQQIADPEVHASLAATPAPNPPTPGHECPTPPAQDAAGDGLATGPLRAAGTPACPGLRYHILRPHAKGGLGEVFVARDEELGREVALKEIQTEHADDPESRTRFVLEAEVTGNLEHPGIVPVYGLGRYDNGRPYYAMRLVRGDSLHDAIRRFHEADAAARKPGERVLELRNLLGRFVDVCNAVAYAHSRGVLHRDLKASNVMLGKYGETLVVDWGLAKAVGRPEGTSEATLRTGSADLAATRMGTAVGTPAYMSPEQAAGRLDLLGPASDVYSLGATLYCLLTGKAPFAGKDVAEVIRKVQGGDFPPPRQVKKEVPPTLEAICLKAMALKPEGRYASAQALADEIEHWLADEPVAAYGEPWTARAGRWVRRHRTKVTAAVAAVAVAAVCLATATVLLAAANRRERTQKERADRNLAKARKAVEDYCTNVAADVRLKQVDLHELRKKLLQTAVPFYEELIEQEGDDAELQADRGKAYLRLAFLQAEMGEGDEAIANYRQMQAIFAELDRGHPGTPKYRQDLALSHNNLGNLLQARGQFKEAEDAYRQALAILETLARDFPTVPDYRRDLARSHNNLGFLLQARGQFKEAEDAYRQALAIQEKLARDSPYVPEHRRGLALSHNNLGILLKARGQFKEAEDAYRQALDIREKLARDFPSIPEHRNDLAHSHHNLGNLLQPRGQVKEAEGAYRQALAILETLARDFPTIPQYRRDLALSHSNMGNLLKGRGQLKEAEGAYRQALAILEKLARDFPTIPNYRSDLAGSHNNLGNLLKGRGQVKEAEQAFRQALAILEKLASDFPEVLDHSIALGGGYVNTGHLARDNAQPKAALVWYAKAIPTLQAVLDKEPRQATARLFLRNAHWGRAATLTKLARHAEAVKDWDRAIELAEVRFRPQFRLKRAEALAHAGDHGKAFAEANKLVEGKNVPGDLLYNAACVCALASASVKDNPTLKDQYAARAIELLTKAREGGYFKDPKNVAHMKKDSDLDSLRSRSDYKKLVAELEAVQKGRP
jgi:serine/threonine-protein kinase